MPFKVVIDTNILLVSISRRSPYHWIFSGLRDGQFNLLVTTPIMLEYEEIIARYMGAPIANKIVQQLGESPYVHHQHVYYHWRLIVPDPDDNKFVDCALAGNADHIITHDRHFDCLRDVEFPTISWIPAEAFRRLLEKTE